MGVFEGMGISFRKIMMALSSFMVGATAFVSLMGFWLLSDPKMQKTYKSIRAPETKPWFYQSIGNAPLAMHQENQDIQNSYTLEIQVAETKTEAEQVVDELGKIGIKAYYTPLARQGRVVYRIRQGIFANEQTAEKASIALRAQQQVSNRVIRLN